MPADPTYIFDCKEIYVKIAPYEKMYVLPCTHHSPGGMQHQNNRKTPRRLCGPPHRNRTGYYNQCPCSWSRHRKLFPGRTLCYCTLRDDQLDSPNPRYRKEMRGSLLLHRFHLPGIPRQPLAQWILCTGLR